MTQEQAVLEGTGMAALTPYTPLMQVARAFELYMTNEEYSDNTIRSFRSDLRLLGDYLGHNRLVGRISTADLNRFLEYLLHERGVPCSPKSYARRVTTLKVFFKWLHKGGVLPEDPAAPVIQQSVSPPLPEILSDEEIERAQAVTQEMWSAAKPDPRPHLLLNLLLDTAMKKSECMGIQLKHIARDAADGPFVQIRYDNPARKVKERKLALSPDTLAVLDDYLEQYEPQDALFPCTARNLEYVLTDVAQAADLPNGLSFEMLRWTSAARDYKAKLSAERQRQKMGLSKASWRDVKVKLARLAQKAL
jgi:site-specific recombinase XerD